VEVSIIKPISMVKKIKCPYCSKYQKLIEKDRKTKQAWLTCYDIYGKLLIGLEEQMLKCPKCKTELRSVQTEFKGFYNDKGKLSKKDKHVHKCSKCKWKSEEYNGTFVSRD
jgi:DNA-directed RNA polymerase subunit RPC12/RpoP